MVRLLQEKLQIITTNLACKKQNLLSLIGILFLAAKVGMAFLRRLIDLSSSVDKLDHFVWLNMEAIDQTSTGSGSQVYVFRVGMAAISVT